MLVPCYTYYFLIATDAHVPSLPLPYPLSILTVDPYPDDISKMYTPRPAVINALKDFICKALRDTNDLEGYHGNVLKYALASPNTSPGLAVILLILMNAAWNLNRDVDAGRIELPTLDFDLLSDISAAAIKLNDPDPFPHIEGLVNCPVDRFNQRLQQQLADVRGVWGVDRTERKKEAADSRQKTIVDMLGAEEKNLDEVYVAEGADDDVPAVLALESSLGDAVQGGSRAAAVAAARAAAQEIAAAKAAHKAAGTVAVAAGTAVGPVSSTHVADGSDALQTGAPQHAVMEPTAAAAAAASHVPLQSTIAMVPGISTAGATQQGATLTPNSSHRPPAGSSLCMPIATTTAATPAPAWGSSMAITPASSTPAATTSNEGTGAHGQVDFSQHLARNHGRKRPRLLDVLHARDLSRQDMNEVFDLISSHSYVNPRSGKGVIDFAAAAREYCSRHPSYQPSVIQALLQQLATKYASWIEQLHGSALIHQYAPRLLPQVLVPSSQKVGQPSQELIGPSSGPHGSSTCSSTHVGADGGFQVPIRGVGVGAVQPGMAAPSAPMMPIMPGASHPGTMDMMMMMLMQQQQQMATMQQAFLQMQQQQQQQQPQGQQHQMATLQQALLQMQQQQTATMQQALPQVQQQQPTDVDISSPEHKKQKHDA